MSHVKLDTIMENLEAVNGHFVQVWESTAVLSHDLTLWDLNSRSIGLEREHLTNLQTTEDPSKSNGVNV